MKISPYILILLVLAVALSGAFYAGRKADQTAARVDAIYAYLQAMPAASSTATAPAPSTPTDASSLRRPLYLRDLRNDASALAVVDSPSFNHELVLGKSTPTAYFSTSDFTLAVPYNDNWGNTQLSVPAYEQEGGLVHFGPLFGGEMMGFYRAAKLSMVPARSEAAIMADPDSKSYSWAEGSDGTVKVDPVKAIIGGKTVYKTTAVSTEGGWAKYELVGKRHNFQFVAPDYGVQGGDLLEWAIMRFQEK